MTEMGSKKIETVSQAGETLNIGHESTVVITNIAPMGGPDIVAFTPNGTITIFPGTTLTVETPKK